MSTVAVRLSALLAMLGCVPLAVFALHVRTARDGIFTGLLGDAQLILALLSLACSGIGVVVAFTRPRPQLAWRSLFGALISAGLWLLIISVVSES